MYTPQVTCQHVWYYGWITAVATGFGAVPFVFIKEPNKFWMGVSNGKCSESTRLDWLCSFVEPVAVATSNW
jgi:ZIP family zinc transporter